MAACALECAESADEPVRDPQSPAGIPYTTLLHVEIASSSPHHAFYVDGSQNHAPSARRLGPGVMGPFRDFFRRGDQILDAHQAAREAFAGKAHVLIVEKPGVEFLEQHPNRGTAAEGSLEFHREHTLERWAESLDDLK